MSERRMDAYYYGFDPTGVEAVDLILHAVACAGKAYHHTESWCDTCSPYGECEGESPIDWIQNAANKAAKVISASHASGRVAGLREAEWPNVIAPSKFDNPDPGWEDPRVPDLTKIWRLAREVGYSVGLHGSLKRDVDLIAVPWTEQAVGNAALVDHLCTGLPAQRISGPEHKPHGRVAVTLQIDGYFKPIDLSIAPRIDVQIEQAAQGVTSE